MTTSWPPSTQVRRPSWRGTSTSNHVNHPTRGRIEWVGLTSRGSIGLTHGDARCSVFKAHCASETGLVSLRRRGPAWGPQRATEYSASGRGCLVRVLKSCESTLADLQDPLGQCFSGNVEGLRQLLGAG